MTQFLEGPTPHTPSPSIRGGGGRGEGGRGVPNMHTSVCKRILKIQKKEKQNLFANFADYTCIKCDRHVLCTGCNLWIHQRCAGITKAEYQNAGNNKEELWYCRPCKANMFPFYDLSNYQFYNFVSSEIFTTKAKTPENKTKTISSSNTNCSVCV